MSVIKPFRALRPSSGELAKLVSSIPYDVCSREELHALVENNPISFLRVTRAEAEVSNEIHPETQTVFDLAKQNLQRFIDEKVLTLEAEPALYVYRLSTDDGQSQTGVVACCSLDEYENDLIKKHEKVRPDKVEDRTRHIVTLRAQTGLIFLAFRSTQRIANLIDETVQNEPLFDFVSAGEIRNTVWRVSAAEDFVAAFADIPSLYVADGHHRLEAASLARKILSSVNSNGSDRQAKKNEEYNYVIAGIFPDTDLRILPYNRIVRDLNNLSETEFWQRVGENFTVVETGSPQPARRGEICVYLEGNWSKIDFRKPKDFDANPTAALDVSILQNYILEPILGIKDVQTDKRIEFVGGIRGSGELERLVDSGNAKIAFSMYPTSIEDLFNVADDGGIMPPKSTWFEPKLRDGLLIHLI